MASERQEIVARYGGAITPKLHLLEEHVVNQMIYQYLGSGLGLLGEQGGELIHAKFNSLLRVYADITNQTGCVP